MRLERLQRDFDQWCIRQIAEAVDAYRDGFVVELFNADVKWILPVFSHGITDWPEGQLWSNVKQGATVSRRNCRVCTHPTIEFGDTQQGLVYPRRRQLEVDLLREHWDEREAAGEKVKGKRAQDEREHSLWLTDAGINHAQLYCNRFGYFSFFPPDILHTVPQGCVKLLKEICLAYTCKLLASVTQVVRKHKLHTCKLLANVTQVASKCRTI